MAKQNSGTMLDQAIYTTHSGSDVAAAEATNSAHAEDGMQDTDALKHLPEESAKAIM